MTIFGKRIHFHRWKNILTKENYTFRGVPCTRDVKTNYRYCPGCDTIEEERYSSTYYWKTVAPCEKKILLADMIFTKKECKDEYAYFLLKKSSSTK